MLKKVHITEPEGKLSAIREPARCPICDRVSVNSGNRDCDSEDVAHKICQQDFIPTKESGDSVAGLKLSCDNIKTSSEMKPYLRNTLASGDHHHCSKCFRAIAKSKSLNNIDANKTINSRFSLPEEVKGVRGNTMEATIKYKNVNFRESDSLFSIVGINEEEIIKNDTEKLIDITHRPIHCPVTDCHKMIARASILQHFIFDHSKTPRKTLNISEEHRVYINISAITKEIRCYAVFLMKIDAPLDHTGSDTPVNGGYKNASFLLMGVRMQSAETINKPHGSCIYIRHAHTQTETRKSSKINLSGNSPKEIMVASVAERYLVNHHDAIMLWICNLGDTTYYYNISIKRIDKILGYSFTGEALNIGKFLDLSEMYNQLECLRILEKHSIKLINEQNELEVTVNIFK